MTNNVISVKSAYKDGITPGLKRTQAEALKTGSVFGHSFGPAGTALGKLEKGVHGFGGALSHAGGQIKGFAGSIGLLAGGAGMLGLVGAVESSIERTKQFGEVVDRLNSVTGLSVETTSQLAGALAYFGIEGDAAIKIATMAEKNLGKMGVASAKGAVSASSLAKAQEAVKLATLKLHEVESKQGATRSQILAAQQRLADATRRLKDIEAARAKGISSYDTFYAKYGLRLTDNAGKLKDFNQLLLDSADYYNNKEIPAQTKAAAMAAIYGKQWGDLVEVFEQGSGKIKEAEAQAAKLGLTLSGKNVDDLLKLRDATRDWNQALGGLQLKIGVVLIPMLTKLSTKATEFVANHGDEIVQFFKDGAKFAGELGGEIKDTVVPMVKKIGEVWKGLPEDVKKLFIGGIVANKTMKVLFDVSGTDVIKSLASGLIKGVLGMNAGVVNIRAAVVNGGGGGVGSAVDSAVDIAKTGGWMALISGAATTAATAAAVAALGFGIGYGLPTGLTEPASGYGPNGADQSGTYALKTSYASGSSTSDPIGDRIDALNTKLANLVRLQEELPPNLSSRLNPQVKAVQEELTRLKLPGMERRLKQLKDLQETLPPNMAKKLQPQITRLENEIKRVRAAVLAPEIIRGPGLAQFSINKTYARATGGPVQRGIPYLVGENRPEIFVPETSGTIRNGLAGSAVGPLDVNVNVSAASSLVTPGFARDIAAQLGPIIALWLQRQGLLPRTGGPLRG